MRRRGVRAAIGLGILLAAAACPIPGDGELAEETRTIDAAIDRLEVLDGFVVDVTLDPDRGPGAEVTVRGDRNLLETFYTEVHSGSALSIALKPTQESHPVAPRSASVVTRDLTTLYVGEDASLTVATLVGPGIGLRAADDGIADLTLGDPATLAAEGLGRASITLRGALQDLEVTTQDAASVAAGELVAARIHVDLGGTGEVVLCPTESLTGTVRGPAVVTVACEPAFVDLEVVGDGVVQGPGA
ncbi:MAG: DUF2807 domain-containing protein [Nannocystaceae bacterium]